MEEIQLEVIERTIAAYIKKQKGADIKVNVLKYVNMFPQQFKMAYANAEISKALTVYNYIKQKDE